MTPPAPKPVKVGMDDEAIAAWERKLREEPTLPNWHGLEAMIARIRADAATIRELREERDRLRKWGTDSSNEALCERHGELVDACFAAAEPCEESVELHVVRLALEWREAWDRAEQSGPVWERAHEAIRENADLRAANARLQAENTSLGEQVLLLCAANARLTAENAKLLRVVEAAKRLSFDMPGVEIIDGEREFDAAIAALDAGATGKGK